MKLRALCLLFGLAAFFVNCSDDYDDNPTSISVNDFIWKGLNQYYYWLAETSDLADNRFANTSEYESFINSYPSSIDFFNYLTNYPEDRFSFILADYTVLEQALTGNLESNGMEFKLYQESGTTNVFGVVTYILPNSDASSKNIQRGDIFYAINGTTLTTENYTNYIYEESMQLSMGDLVGNQIVPNGETVALNKYPYSENPVYLTKTFTIGTKKIGYLIYNGFYTEYEPQLNDAFAYFQSENVTHLILDLRYNSGGSVATATRLASMITGQFTGQIFAKQKWNYKLEDYFSSNPEAILNRFTNEIDNGNSINSLQLNSLYVITSKKTASASELVINGLQPYINVTLIGDTTTGKNVGSVTLYDSPTYRKVDVNPNHFYAMQPIVLKIENSNGFSDYSNGIVPTVAQVENPASLGVLGETSDPLLTTALNYIDANGRFSSTPNQESVFTTIEKSASIEEQLKNEMYVD